MDDSLYFGEQHLAVRDMVRSFAQEHVAPVAARFDETQEFPWENVKRMGELGLLGIPWSEELGGAGLDTLSYMIALHEMAKVDASHAITISAHTTLGDRKSTRLNSSHANISYAVFCLKKKKNQLQQQYSRTII